MFASSTICALLPVLAYFASSTSAAPAGPLLCKPRLQGSSVRIHNEASDKAWAVPEAATARTGVTAGANATSSVWDLVQDATGKFSLLLHDQEAHNLVVGTGQYGYLTLKSIKAKTPSSYQVLCQSCSTQSEYAPGYAIAAGCSFANATTGYAAELDTKGKLRFTAPTGSQDQLFSLIASVDPEL